MLKIEIRQCFENTYAVTVSDRPNSDMVPPVDLAGLPNVQKTGDLSENTINFLETVLGIPGIKRFSIASYMFYVTLVEREPWSKVSDRVVDAICSREGVSPRDANVVLPKRNLAAAT